MQKHSRTHTEPVSGIVPLVAAAALACGIALAVSAVLLFVAAAAAVGREDPDALVAPFGYGIAALASLGAGWLTVRQVGRGPLVCGLTAALLMAVLTALGGLLLPGEGDASTAHSLILHAAMAALSVGGAYLGRRRPRRRTRSA